jgi:hypothetical protein
MESLILSKLSACFYVWSSWQVLCHLAELDAPWNCPHGRPTMRHLADLSSLCSQWQRDVQWCGLGSGVQTWGWSTSQRLLKQWLIWLLCGYVTASKLLLISAWEHEVTFYHILSAWDSVKIEIECNFGWVQKKPLVSVWTFHFLFLMEPPVQSWDQFFEFLKPSVLVIFSKNLELVQFKTSVGSICITYNFIFWKNCVILIMFNWSNAITCLECRAKLF